MKIHTSIYDPGKTYEENFVEGPFGDYADGKVFENKGEPQYSFLGKPVYLPFGIGAGPLPNHRFVQAAWNKGFDIVTFKSVRTSTYPCHPIPNILPISNKEIGLSEFDTGVVVGENYTDPLTVTNSFGIPSLPPEEWKTEIQKTLALKKKGQVLINAFQGTDRHEGFDAYLKDHVEGIEMLVEIGVEILEINLSCPNEGNHQLMCFDVPGTEQILKEVKKVRGHTPLLVKIAYFKDKNLLEQFVTAIGPLVDGIVAINTLGIPVQKQDGSSAFPGEGRQKAGVSGAGIRWAGLEMVEYLGALKSKLGLPYTIIGVGGVQSAEDFRAYREKGADAVLSVAGAMWNPYLAQEIKSELL